MIDVRREHDSCATWPRDVTLAWHGSFLCVWMHIALCIVGFMSCGVVLVDACLWLCSSFSFQCLTNLRLARTAHPKSASWMLVQFSSNRLLLHTEFQVCFGPHCSAQLLTLPLLGLAQSQASQSISGIWFPFFATHVIVAAMALFSSLPMAVFILTPS
jgi:hypothetical protein